MHAQWSSRNTFHDWIGFQDLLFYPRVLATDSGQELQNEFCGLCFPCTTLSTDDDTLVPLSSLHEVVGIVCCGKDVWCFIADLFVFVPIDVCLIIDGEELVGVDCNENGAS